LNIKLDVCVSDIQKAHLKSLYSNLNIHIQNVSN